MARNKGIEIKEEKLTKRNKRPEIQYVLKMEEAEIRGRVKTQIISARIMMWTCKSFPLHYLIPLEERGI